MTRLLCLPLLLVFVLPASAQDVPAVLPPLLPPDSALLTRMKEKLSTELQQIQQMLGVVSDAQLVETLKTQQADLTKQLLEVTQQMQAEERNPVVRDTRAPEFSQEVPRMQGMFPPRTREPVFPTPPPDPRGGSSPVIPGMPRNDFNQNPMMPPNPEIPGQFPGTPMQGYSPTQPFPGGGYPGGTYPGGTYPGGMGYAPASPWGDPDRMWDATPWGPRLPRELVETRQSVESLRKEIADLKETVKALETQIQLLSRNILLERVKEKENGN